MAICGSCQAMINAYSSLQSTLSYVNAGVPVRINKVNSISNSIMPAIVINGKPIDDGDFKIIAAELSKITQLLDEMIGECGYWIGVYSQCGHLVETSKSKN